MHLRVVRGAPPRLTDVEDDAEFAAFAALVRRGSDVPDMLGRLADRLERALPDQVKSERTGVLRGRRLESLVVDLAGRRLRVELDGTRATAWVDHMVRGVCLHSDELTVDAWLDAVAAALSSEAQRSTEVRLALQEALG
jgi:hypothetical protein